jgi:hypothetical protein
MLAAQVCGFAVPIWRIGGWKLTLSRYCQMVILKLFRLGSWLRRRYMIIWSRLCRATSLPPLAGMIVCYRQLVLVNGGLLVVCLET